MSKRIPESRAQVVKPGRRIASVDQIGPAHHVHHEEHGFGHRVSSESDSRTCFDEIGPPLAIDVDREIGIPIKLGTQNSGSSPIAAAELLVKQEIVPEAADENTI